MNKELIIAEFAKFEGLEKAHSVNVVYTQLFYTHNVIVTLQEIEDVYDELNIVIEDPIITEPELPFE